MDKIEQELKEFKEIRRGLAILFLALLTMEGNALFKYVDKKDKLLENLMILGLLGLILLGIGIIIVSFKIWRLLKNEW